MAYTNRNFMWDLDALKRFYEKYIVKWLNSAVSWTEAQKKQARANLGLGNGDIDNEPIAGSNNLITSGAVNNIVNSKASQSDLTTLNGKVSTLETAVNSGGSVDSRIAAAKAEIKGTATSACDTLGEAEAKINANTTAISNEITRAEAAEEALDGRVDTLEDTVGSGGSVDSRISAAIAIETTRAQGAESTLQTNIDTEATRAQTAESALNSGKADKATTLAGYGITNAYTKSETYTKTEVNGLVDTPHQEYVTVEQYADLPATGSADTIYRVSNWDGSANSGQGAVDATVYSEYAWDGSQYKFLCVKSQIGEVFDISVYNNNAVYADLAEALGTDGANVPESLRKGGMSVKFIQGSVQSADNKYVQYCCMAQNFTTDVTQWQGVDDEPTAWSENLVKSDGVYKAIRANNRVFNVDKEGLYICDSEGKALVRLDVLDSKSGFGPNLTAAINLLIAAGITDVESAITLLEEQIETFSSGAIVRSTIDDRDNFYLCNEDGEVLIGFINGRWMYYEASKVRQDGFLRRTGNLGVNDVWVLGENSVMNDKMLAFSGDITSFTSLIIGHGHGTDHNDYGLSNEQWNSSRVVIDTTNITVYKRENSEVSNTFAHGLTIENNIQVSIVTGVNHKAMIKVVSNGESFSQEVDWLGTQGDIFIKSNAVLTDCVASWTCNKLKGGVWLFGASYFSLTFSKRWPSYLINDGFTGNVFNGWPGAGSPRQLECVMNLLNIATPDTIIWAVGMNNPDDGVVNPKWNEAYESLKTVCASKEINLILTTYPCVKGGLVPDTEIYEFRDNNYKNAIVRASGYRYIDFEKAVGADPVTGEWYEGMLDTDGVHPTAKGAKAMYMRAISDAPELMQ